MKAFLTSEKRARWGQYLAQPKRRREILSTLDRPLPCLPGAATPVPEDQDYPGGLEALLKAKGAPATCHLLLAAHRLDGRELPLAEALNLICLQGQGALISCLPGRLAYHRPAAPRGGVILEK